MPDVAHADDILTVGDVAQLAQVSPRTVTGWAKDNKLPAWRRTVGNIRLFKRSDVEAFLSRREGGRES